MPATKVQPGDLRKPIHILSRSDTKSATGGSVPTFTDILAGAAIWAKDEHGRSNWHDQSGKIVTTVYHTYTIHFNLRVVVGLYIQDPDYPKMMYIAGVTDPTRMRQWMQLTCTDVEG